VLSNELETCLNEAFHRAREARHEYLTVEHLLLGILDTPEAREILGGCGADLVQLKQELQDHLDQSIPRLGQSDEREVRPTIGFQRVLQRAVFHVQSSGNKAVGVVNVLIAVFSEKESEAVHLLKRHHVTRAEAIKYIGHDQEKSVGQPEVPVTGRTIRMARLLGPALIGITVTGWLNRDLIASAARPAFAAYVYLSGALIFVGGLGIVSTHNIWSRRWPVLITLVGWFAIIAGMGCMVAPVSTQNAGRGVPVLSGLLLVLLSLGVFLTFKAFKRPGD
jgi:hypothetical protein